VHTNKAVAMKKWRIFAYNDDLEWYEQAVAWRKLSLHSGERISSTGDNNHGHLTALLMRGSLFGMPGAGRKNNKGYKFLNLCFSINKEKRYFPSHVL
jgi:hypothetical protein